MHLTFDDFWKYYIGEIEKQVPKDLWNSFVEIQTETKKSKNKKPEKWTPQETHAHIIQNQIVKQIHNSLKKLTDIQVGELNYFIRTIVKFPKKIALVYTPQIDTYASWYNEPKKQFEILYPTITLFVKKFPESLKAGIMHELGHIFNGDSLVKKNVLHSQCTNIAMDARINMHLDYQMLDYLSRCLQFINEPSYFVKPEEWYPSIGLPVTPGGYSWDFAHEQYHFFDDARPKNPNFPQPKSGQPQLTQEEAEQIVGTFNPDQIQEGEGQGEEQEGQEGQEGEGKPGSGKSGDKKGKGKGQPGDGEPQDGGDQDGEGSGGEEGKEKKPGQGKSGDGTNGETGDEKKPGEGKADGEGEGKDGKKGKNGEKEGDKKGNGEEGGKEGKTSGGEKDPTKNSRQNKTLLKNIDKTIGVLNKLKEKYA